MTEQGECQETDSAIVVDGQTVPLADASLDIENNLDRGGREAGIGLEAGQQTFSGSFTIEFEDEEEAQKFREYFF